MNLNEVKNAFGRQAANSINPNNKSDGSGLLLLMIVVAVAYLGYNYILKHNNNVVEIEK
jgi:hypothetical protein